MLRKIVWQEMPNTFFQIIKETELELLIKLQDSLGKNGQTLRTQHQVTTISVQTLEFMEIQNITKLYQISRVLIEPIKLKFLILLIRYLILNSFQYLLINEKWRIEFSFNNKVNKHDKHIKIILRSDLHKFFSLSFIFFVLFETGLKLREINSFCVLSN